ncbi:MAG: hypothetical protein SPG10_04935 [Enterocloster clostridioformis]|nr:hypothetical protein [Enterocloster clostridioformis]MDY5476269.1 hypothetical protein [Enterocloster clostridioformis]
MESCLFLGSSNELDDVLYASASHVIGSDPLPDIFASVPAG